MRRTKIDQRVLNLITPFVRRCPDRIRMTVGRIGSGALSGYQDRRGGFDVPISASARLSPELQIQSRTCVRNPKFAAFRGVLSGDPRIEGHETPWISAVVIGQFACRAGRDDEANC